MHKPDWILAPYLRVSNAANAIDFYVSALGAKEIMRHHMPDGTIAHAELDLHGNMLCLADSDPSVRMPNQGDGMSVPVMLYLTVPDVDAVFARALQGGATMTRALADQEYGHRNGGFIDPFGHRWYVTMELSGGGRAETMEAATATS